MTGRYPSITKCPKCKKDVKFFRGCIASSGKKCSRCNVKLIMPGTFTANYYDNQTLIEKNVRLIQSYEKQYFTADGVTGSEFPNVCPHGLWRCEE